jgi:hypothetical protein
MLPILCTVLVEYDNAGRLVIRIFLVTLCPSPPTSKIDMPHMEAGDVASCS